jgi:AraC-like DNA-binding protein
MIFTLLATAGRIVHRLVEKQGLDADALYRECGIDPTKLDDATARYPTDRIRKLWRLAQQRILDPCWGLAGGEVWQPTDYYALGYAVLASRTLEAALKRLERYYHIVCQDMALQMSIEPDSLCITYTRPSAESDLPALQDTRLSVILRMCRDVYGANLPLRQVQLCHPAQACGYEHYFGCPVRYGGDTSGITFALDTVRKSLPGVSRALAKESDRLLQDLDKIFTGTKLIQQVRQAIVLMLPSGKPTANNVARELALSPRTLQRKLQEEGTSYKTVSEDVRKGLAMRYVRSGMPLSEVTYLTGFANQSAFSRAYKAWTGRAPTEDRDGG